MVRQGVAKIAVSVNSRQWRLVSSFRSAGPDDAVFVLDSQTGSVKFGDGVHGAKPSVGSTITVSYRHGSGSSGNISKKIYDATDVKLIQGDLAEAWREGNTDYSTVAMNFAINDSMVERASGRTVEGGERSEVTELWTFMRARGGNWLLSAIQQT